MRLLGVMLRDMDWFAHGHMLCHVLTGLVETRQPQVLVLAPTRELVHQITEVLADAGQRCGLSCVSATGGSSKKPQARALRQGAALLAATPGRLQDLVDEGSCRSSTAARAQPCQWSC